MTPRAEVMRFAEHMEAKLRENDGIKEHWRVLHSFKPEWALAHLLKHELDELLEAINAIYDGTATAADVIRECADVANYAMMIADLLDAGRPEATPRGTK